MARRKRGTPEQQARRALIACTDNPTGFARLCWTASRRKCLMKIWDRFQSCSQQQNQAVDNGNFC